MRRTLYALTLHRPWCWAIVAPWRPYRQDLEAKDLENRTWPPWRSIVGRYIAIHSGATWDSRGADALREMGYPVPDKTDWTGGRIVGLVRVTGRCVEGSVTAEARMWFSGPIGWTLEDPIAIEPVPCRGAQGLWKVEGEVLERVRTGFRAALEAQL